MRFFATWISRTKFGGIKLLAGENMKDDQTTTEPFVAPELAKGLEQSQIGRYHTKGGTGFAAEDANAFADRIRAHHDRDAVMWHERNQPRTSSGVTASNARVMATDNSSCVRAAQPRNRALILLHIFSIGL